MKTNKIARFVLAAGATLAFAAACAFPSNSNAADALKGAQLLAGQRPAAVQAYTVPLEVNANLAACPACTNATKVDITSAGRGAFAKTTVITTHQCPLCKTAIKTVGSGKAKVDVAVHSCSNGTVATCCSGMVGM